MAETLNTKNMENNVIQSHDISYINQNQIIKSKMSFHDRLTHREHKRHKLHWQLKSTKGRNDSLYRLV